MNEPSGSVHGSHHREHEHENVHPALRPVEPEHPMMLDGEVTPGDTEFMLRCFFEEYLLSGMASEQIWSMCLDPQYQALHAARLALGDERSRALLEDVLRCVGQRRVVFHETGCETCSLTSLRAPSTKGP